jgi:flagellar protein FliO/FliZ
MKRLSTGLPVLALLAVLAGGALSSAPALAQAPAPAPTAAPATVITNPGNRTVAPVKAGEPATVVPADTPPAPDILQPQAATPEQQAALAGARSNTPAQPVQLPAAPSAAGSLLQTVLALGFVLAIVVGLAWLLKRFGPRTVTGGSHVKLVGALSVGARERILVVEVGEQWIVVGASPGRMNALATMPRQEAGPADLLRQQAMPATNFAEWFKQTIEKRNGKQ